jgi:hypothetical protein
MFDTGGTPTICERSFITSMVSPPTDYVFESYVLYKSRKSGKKVIRPRIKYGQRKYGKSHWQSGFAAELKLMKLIIQGYKNWD